MSDTAASTLFDAAPTGLADLSPDGHIRSANPAFGALFDTTAETLCGRELRDLVPESSRARLEDALEAAASSATAIPRLRITPGGGPALELHLSARRDGDGALLGLVLVAVAADPAATAADYYAEMFTRNTAPKLLIDPETGAIVDANPAAVRFYGYPREALLRLRIQDINDQSEEAVKAEMARAKSEQRRYFRFRHRLAGGELRDVEVYSGPVHMDGVTYLYSIIHDVTEARRYQRRLEEYKRVFDALPVGIYRNCVGDRGAFLDANPAMARIFEAGSVRELLRHTTAELYRAPDERMRFSDDLRASGTVHQREVALQTLKGRPIWASITAQSHETEDGEVVFEGIVEDITERKGAEAALEQKEAHYRDLVENQSQFIERYLPDTTILFANRALAEFFGTTPEALHGQRWVEMLPEAERAQAEAHLADFSPDDSVRAFENSMQRSDGEWRWVHWTNRAFFNDAGTLTHFQSVGIDITDRREAERARDRLARILEATPDLVVIASPAGETLYMNHAARALLLGPEKAPPESVREYHPEWAGKRIFQEAIPAAARDGLWQGETAIRDAAGREVPVSQVILAHRDEHGEVNRLSTIMRDIRRRKELEARLHARQAALQRLQAITGDPGRELDEKLRDILALGCELFELPYGIVSRIEGEDYWIRQAVSPDGCLAPGQHFELGVTYCVHTLHADGAVGFDHVAESGIRSHPCYEAMGLESYLGVPIRVGEQVYGTLNFSRPEPRQPYSDFEWELLKLMGHWISYELTRESNRQALERAATRDALTGVFNRLHFEQVLDQEWTRAQRYGQPFSLIMFDIDHFKAVNDTHGHDVGDRVLQTVTRCVADTIRETDQLARWGGEEFMVLLPQTRLPAALELAERLRAAVAVRPFGPAAGITISLGAGQWRPGMSRNALLKETDDALYEAKRRGRNHVAVVRPDTLMT